MYKYKILWGNFIIYKLCCINVSFKSVVLIFSNKMLYDDIDIIKCCICNFYVINFCISSW